jgi:ppGpp synthetase/RelA/SpoT-type nucleotidyltranferase
MNGDNYQYSDIYELFWRGYRYSTIVDKLKERGCNISLRTLKRNLNDLGLGRRTYAPNEVIQEAVQCTQANGGMYTG